MGTTLQDIRHEKVSPFVKFEIILPLLCFLLDLPTNKHCRTWSSMIYLWIYGMWICGYMFYDIFLVSMFKQIIKKY